MTFHNHRHVLHPALLVLVAVAYWPPGKSTLSCVDGKSRCGFDLTRYTEDISHPRVRTSATWPLVRGMSGLVRAEVHLPWPSCLCHGLLCPSAAPPVGHDCVPLPPPVAEARPWCGNLDADMREPCPICLREFSSVRLVPQVCARSSSRKLHHAPRNTPHRVSHVPQYAGFVRSDCRLESLLEPDTQLLVLLSLGGSNW